MRWEWWSSSIIVSISSGMMILPIVSNGMMNDATFRDNPYHNTAILGGMWGARMDTGMRNTLDQSFRQLINSVRRIFFKPSSVITMQWSVHPDSAVKALAQRLGSDDARQLGLAEGGRILTQSGTNICETFR